MYSLKKISSVLFAFLSLATWMSCTTEPVQPFPSKNISVSTDMAEPLSGSSAFVMGHVKTMNSLPLIRNGFYYGTLLNPEIGGIKVELPVTGESFSTTLNDLDPGITYYVKAFASDGSGEYIGNVISFRTH